MLIVAIMLAGTLWTAADARPIIAVMVAWPLAWGLIVLAYSAVRGTVGGGVCKIASDGFLLAGPTVGLILLAVGASVDALYSVIKGGD